MSKPTDLLDKVCRDPRLEISISEFEALFCNRCRNQECVRANWGRDLFQKRVLTQEERLLNPTQGNPAQYKHLVDFASRFQEAMRLEVSDRKGDWSIPEIPILDGRTTRSESSIGDAVDHAVRALEKVSGPNVAHKVEEVREVTQCTLTSASKELDCLGASQMPEQEIEQRAEEFQHVGGEFPPVEAVPLPRLGNLPSQDGMMIGPPPPPESDKSDPWAPAKDRKVKPGATIRMGNRDD